MSADRAADRRDPKRDRRPPPDPKLARLKTSIVGGADPKDEVYRRLAEAVREIMRRG
jgi:hypothetical protein